jgi:hypothetical protein
MLANVFLLEWNVIETFFPYNHRPTVTHNTHGFDAENNGGRKTVQMYNNTPRGSNYGRKTEAFKFEQQSKGGDQTKELAADIDDGKANVYQKSQIDKELGRWNWGGFFCNWLWGICNGIYWPAFVIIIGIIPYIGPICALALSIYLGLKGTKLAWNKSKDKDFDSFKRRQRNWAIGGIICFIIAIVSNLYIFKYGLNI